MKQLTITVNEVPSHPGRNQSCYNGLIAGRTIPEAAMKIASILLAGTLALGVGGVARADDSQTGLVTQLNRLTNTVSINIQ